MAKVLYSFGKSYSWKLIIPEILKPRLEIISIPVLSEAEETFFSMALKMLATGLERDGFIAKEDHAIIFFLDADEIPCRLIHPAIQASYSPLILYHMNRIRKGGYGPHEYLVIFLEELVHCFYHLRDEDATKAKVVELIQAHIPALTRESLYERFEDPGRAPAH